MICERLVNHFKEHKTLGWDDFWRIYQEEVRAQMRRDQAELEGGRLQLDHSAKEAP
jgi:uncharacterized protein YeaO (DUF488 family)